MYAGDLVLCGESEEDLRAKVGWFAEVCRKIGLKGTNQVQMKQSAVGR